MIHSRTRGLFFHTPIEPTWLVGEVKRGLEYKIRDRFAEFGVRSFFPGKVIVRHDRYGNRRDRERATVTGYVFTLIEALPDVEYMRLRVPGFYRFGTANGKLITVDPDKIVELRGLTAAEAALEEQRREAMRIRAGDTATLLEGALKGWTVDVLSLQNGDAIISTIFGGKTKAKLENLARIT